MRERYVVIGARKYRDTWSWLRADLSSLQQVRCDAASLGVPCTNCVAFSIECKIPTPKRKKTQGGRARDSDRYGSLPQMLPHKLTGAATEARSPMTDHHHQLVPLGG